MTPGETVGRERQRDADRRWGHHRGRVLAGLGLLAILASALPQLATGWPGTTGQWILLAIGALANAAITVSIDWLLIDPPRDWGWLRRLRPPVRLRVLVAGTVALGLLVGIGFAVTDVWARVDRLINGCPEPIQLRILTTIESAGPTRELADAYEQETARRDRNCRTVSVFVYGAADPSVRTALAADWPTNALRDLGPRPDVWLPDSTLQVGQLRTLAANNGIVVPIVEARPIAWSPVVVAVPHSVTAAIQAPRNGADWSDLLTQTAALPGGLVRPDPAASAAGQLATTAIYGRIPSSFTAARQVESQLAAALDGGGYPLDDVSAMLCRQRSADAPKAALITSEQAMMRFNRGDPLVGPCAGVATDRAERGAALVAYYPSATPGLDHAFVRFAWTGTTSTPQTTAAVDFGQWLDGEQGKQALLAIGLRPPAGYEITSPLSEEFGVLPGAVFDRRPPDTARVTAALTRYASARRTGRVLLALDISGSMGDRTRTGATRLAVATEGIRQSLQQMGPADQFGLSVFPANASGQGVKRAIPIGSRDTRVGGQPRLTATANTLAGLRAAGGTPLYAAIVDGVRTVADQSDPDRIAAVVILTDGEDTAGGLSPSDVLNAVRGKGVRVFVVAVGEASCTGQVVAGVTAATGGACYPADFDTVDARLAQVFGLLWEGADNAA